MANDPSGMAENDPTVGRLVRVHLACRASLPIGTSLRVTGTHLWEPTDWRRGNDPSGADDTIHVVPTDGLNASETDDEATLQRRVAMGLRDPRSHWIVASNSIEMVTCPATYPVWRTKQPVVIVVSNNSKAGGILRHRYRYVAVTPGALATRGDVMDDAREMLEMIKLSSGNLNTSYSTSGGNLTTTTTTSQDDFDDAVTTTYDFPPTLWENPFTLREVDAMNLVQGVNAIPTDNELANLPYRELVIDVATGVVSTIGATYTEDGILVDNWNNCNDVTFQPYCELEKHGAQGNDDAIMAVSTSASEDGDNKTIIDAEKVGGRGRRIFIVCYHLPVIVSKDPTTGVWLACWAESLLAKTEGSSFVNAYDPHWVGTVTTNSTIVDDDDRRALQAVLTDMDCTALFFDDDIRDAHYMGFCKQVLWQAFHHLDLLDMRDSLDLDSTKIKLQPDGTLRDVCSSWDQRLVGHWYEAFKTVNSTFAVEVAKLVQPDDIVWIHDYHLSLMPRLLVNEERKMTKANGGGRLTKKIFFLHVPFPPSMIFKEMECGPDILEGMLNADVVGFHGYTDARHFLSSVKRILGVAHESFEGGIIGIKYRKRIVAVTMSSVSIEPPLVSAAMQLQTTIDGEAALRAKHEGRIIIAGLDVAQYLSGVELKLCIYEKLLRDSPTWRNKLVLVQRCLIPGARLLDESTSLRNIRSMVSTIQAKYGDAVIDYEEIFGSSLPLDQRLALWRSSDCLLNTEVRGGLNMLPLEFVYAQKGLEIPGTVITSEFTAVSSILNGALRISPYDMKNTLSTIDKALTMTKDERVGRHFRDIEFVSSSSSSQWIKNILRDVHVNDKEDKSKAKLLRSEIRSVAQFLEHEKDEQFTALDPKDVISAYNLSSRRVIVLDFNGTIVIKEDVDTILKRDVFGSNSDAPPRAVCESLAKLCSDPKNTVYVVSGDINENLERAIGNIPGLGLAASNGSCFSPPSPDRSWLAFDLGVDWGSVKRLTLPIMSKYTARTNGSFIKVAHSSIGWSYFACDPEFGTLNAKCLVIELERELASYDVRFVNLKGIVEVIPRKLNKGLIVKKILRDAVGVDFILCMGDDVSDEKMFTSVFSFAAEMDADHAIVDPSPPVVNIDFLDVPLPAPHVESPIVRRGDAIAPFAFTVAVGKKSSNASQYVDDAEDVADLLVKMAAGSDDAFYERKKERDRQLKQFS